MKQSGCAFKDKQSDCVTKLGVMVLPLLIEKQSGCVTKLGVTLLPLQTIPVSWHRPSDNYKSKCGTATRCCMSNHR